MDATHVHIPIGSVVLFFDPLSREEPGPKGGNQFGYHLGNGEIIFARGRRVIQAHGSTLDVRSAYGPPPECPTDNVGLFFTAHQHSHLLISAGIRALTFANWRFFDTLDFMPQARVYETDAAFNVAWSAFEEALQIGDMVVTLDTTSVLSRLIARIDGGSWSHVALYTSLGYLHEVTTSGRLYRPLDTYRQRHFHVGAYRSFRVPPGGLSSEEAQLLKSVADCATTGHWDYGALPSERATQIRTYCESICWKEWNGYDYKRVCLCGLKKLLHLKTTYPTPNGLLYSGQFYMVAAV